MSPPEVHAVIFDMDGTILDSEPVYRQAFIKAGVELDLPLSAEFFDTLVGLSHDETHKAVVNACGFEFDYDEFIRLFEHHWAQHAADTVTPLKPGLRPILDWLVDRDTPLGIATNSDRQQVELGLGPHDLIDHFHAIVCRSDVSLGKPAPEPYLKAAKRLGVAPQRCYVLEDSNTGVQSAVAAGMRVIVVPDIVKPDHSTREAAHAIVADLHEALDRLQQIVSIGE